MKYRKKPVVIEATRWFKNGDHPLDYSLTHDGLENGELRQFSPEERKANGWEGDIVRYFRHPEVSGESTCNHCGKIMHDHGWIDTLEGGHIVCPGDWIITGIEGEHYPCKPQIFEQTYEPVAQQTDAEIYEALFAAAMNTAKQAMDYVQNNPGKFDARPGDDKLAIVCREFLKDQQLMQDVSEPKTPTTKESWWAGYRAGKGLPADTPRQDAINAPDVSALVEALEQVIKAAPSHGPLWHGSEQIAEARAALTASRKQSEPNTITNADILAIAGRIESCPVSPWWLKDGVVNGDVQAAVLRFARALLDAVSQPEEQPASSHDWDDQDKCRRCGDRDWYASATCTPSTAEDVSHDSQ